MKKMLLLPTVLGAALLFGALPAGAVVHGEPDNGAHPYVAMLALPDASGGGQRCTGTLVSPTVIVTAGHCTFGAVSPVRVRFDDAPTAASFVTGTPYTFAGFDPDNFAAADVGVVVLDEPVTDRGYGELPAAHSLDGLQPGTKTTFTSVGYGAERWFPEQGASFGKIDVTHPLRMVATPHLVSIANPALGPQTLVVSASASTGAACHGDSGGPNFLGTSTTIAGVTSYARGETCMGTTGVFRLDDPDVLAFVESFESW